MKLSTIKNQYAVFALFTYSQSSYKAKCQQLYYVSGNGLDYYYWPFYYIIANGGNY